MSAPTDKPKSDGPPRQPLGNIIQRPSTTARLRPPFNDITDNPSGASGGTARPATTRDAPPVKPGAHDPAKSTGSAAARIAELRSAWERKTPGEKAAWNQETFGGREPPWAGEVSYDDGADVEYEERMRKGGVA